MQGRKLIKTLQTQKQQNSVSDQALASKAAGLNREIVNLSINKGTNSLLSLQNEKPAALTFSKKEDQINSSGNFNLPVPFLQTPQIQLQKKKQEEIKNIHEIQKLKRKNEYLDDPRFTSKRIQEAKSKWKQRINKIKERQNVLSFTESKINLNYQLPRKKYSFDLKSQQKLEFEISSPTAPIRASLNTFRNPEIQLTPSPQLQINQTIPAYSAQLVPPFPISSNTNTLVNSTPFLNVSQAHQTYTSGNLQTLPVQQFKAEPPKQNIMSDTNSSNYPCHVIQHSSNDGTINFHENACMQASMVPYQMYQNTSSLFFPNNSTIQTARQFQRSLIYLKESFDELPVCYSSESIASLKIRDLKQQHKSFAYFVRNMRIIKMKIAEMMQKKQEIAQKNREIAYQGMEKLLNLKKTYIQQNDVINRLQQNSTTLDLIGSQVRTLQTVTHGYFYKKESPFLNPDNGVILLAQIIRQRYKSLYNIYLESVKIPQSQENLQVNPLQILQQQIEFLYWNASALSKLQKKIKNLKMAMDSRQKEQLNLALQSSVNNLMSGEWRNLQIFFELGQILEERLQRDRCWRACQI